MTGSPPGLPGADANRVPLPDHPGDDQIAAAAARPALAVPGVLRLQPGLKHAVGRAARLLFTSGRQDDQLAAAASGIEVSRGDPRSGDRAGEVDSGSSARERLTEVTVRVITAAHPSPRGIAQEVQRAVSDDLAALTGAPVTVVVVIVDVEDVEE